MKKYIFCIVILFLSSACFADDVIIKEWIKKTYRHRVASANEYIYKATGSHNMYEARVLERCMKESTDDPKFIFRKVEEIAAGCLVKMGLDNI